MGKEKIEAMATKFSEKLAIIMLKKYRKFCRRDLTHLDATPIFQIHMRHPVVLVYNKWSNKKHNKILSKKKRGKLLFFGKFKKPGVEIFQCFLCYQILHVCSL